jgi:hypothetical protein
VDYWSIFGAWLLVIVWLVVSFVDYLIDLLVDIFGPFLSRFFVFVYWCLLYVWVIFTVSLSHYWSVCIPERTTTRMKPSNMELSEGLSWKYITVTHCSTQFIARSLCYLIIGRLIGWLISRVAYYLLLDFFVADYWWPIMSRYIGRLRGWFMIDWTIACPID